MGQVIICSAQDKASSGRSQFCLNLGSCCSCATASHSRTQYECLALQMANGTSGGLGTIAPGSWSVLSKARCVICIANGRFLLQVATLTTRKGEASTVREEPRTDWYDYTRSLP
jgi:hypothetical protein